MSPNPKRNLSPILGRGRAGQRGAHLGVLPLCTLLVAAASPLGCLEAVPGAQDGTSMDASATGDGGVLPGPGTGGGDASSSSADGAPPPADLAGCQHGGSLVAALQVTSSAVAVGASGRVILSRRPGGLSAAFAVGGEIHIVTLDASDHVVGTPIVVAGSEVFGLVSGPSDHAVLVSRPPDYMTFVKVSTTGAPLATRNLIGGGDHAVVGTEWFGEFARTGRLAATADGYAAYFALHRRWPDMIGHQGDTLRRLDANGVDAPGQTWDWGCSHSMDQRLAVSGDQVAAFCISDCYPTKSISYNWKDGIISDEPAGNCAGGTDAELGGAAPLSTAGGTGAGAAGAGLWFSYVSGNARPTKDIALVKISPTGQQSQRAFVTADAAVESNVHLAAFDTAQLLLAYEVGGKTYLERHDAMTGAALGALGGPGGPGGPAGSGTREMVTNLTLDPASDLVSVPSPDSGAVANTDVVSASVSGGSLKLARIRACTPP